MKYLLFPFLLYFTCFELKAGYFDEIYFKDLNGKEVKLKEMRGKVVLIDFWATWCGPCIGEIPHLKKVYQKYHKKGFEIIGISLDKNREQLDAFLKRNEILWPQHFDGQGWKNQFAQKYRISGIPATFLLDKDGNVQYKNLRGKQVENAVEELLNREKKTKIKVEWNLGEYKSLLTRLNRQPASKKFSKHKYAILLSTIQINKERYQKNLEQIVKTCYLLNKSGVPAYQIVTFLDQEQQTLDGSYDCSKENVLKAIDELSNKLSEQDQLFIFAFGHANDNVNGLSIATKGERLYGRELGEALGKVNSKKYLFSMCRQSSELAVALQEKCELVVSATSEAKHLNLPYFPKFVLETWLQNPNEKLLPIFIEAGKATQKYYELQGYVPAEMSRISYGSFSSNYPFKELSESKLTKINFENIQEL